MHVEFLGVPGAGKTSLYVDVLDELRRIGVDAVEIDDAVYNALRADMRDRIMGPVVRYTPSRIGRKYYRHLAARSQDKVLAIRGFLLEHPETMIAILEALESRKDVDPRQDLALGWIVELLWKYQLATDPRGAPECLVLDEGFANRAVSLFGYRFSREYEPHIRRYVDSIPEPDLVLVVAADAETAASRSTGRIRFSHLTDREALDYTRDAADCVAATARLLKERGIDVIEVRNDQSPAAASADVQRAVNGWIDRDR